MRQVALVGGLAVVVLSGLSQYVMAGSLPADALPLPNRVATAEMIVIGKVTGFEDKTAEALQTPGGKDKAEYKIATLEVSDVIRAPKGTKKLRIGFIPPPPNVVISPAPFLPTSGMEGCFFLTKHFDGDFEVVNGQLSFLDKNQPNFEKQVALIKRCVKLLEDPAASLKAKEAEDRFLTAAMLLARYRTRKSTNAEEKQIDADESKLILKALAEADWTPAKDVTQLTPMMALMRLPLTEKDGWTPPKDFKELPAYAEKWVKEHESTYRISKFVEK